MASPKQALLIFIDLKPNQCSQAKNIKIQRWTFLRIAFEKMKLFKMHRIIKPTCPAGIERWFWAVTRDVNLSIEREMLQIWLF